MPSYLSCGQTVINLVTSAVIYIVGQLLAWKSGGENFSRHRL